MSSQISQILNQLGHQAIYTSEELISRLTAQGMSDEAARQLLSRSAIRGEIWRSKNFRLPSNGRLFASPAFAGTPLFYELAASKIRETERKGISRCLAALALEEVVTDKEASKLLASPVDEAINANKYPTFPDEVLALSEFGVTESLLPNGQSYLYSKSQYSELDPVIEAIAWGRVSLFRIECVIGRLLIDNLRRQNVLTWNQYQVADPQGGYASFNGQLFTATGYSYLRPVTQWNNGKAVGCPVLVDVYPRACKPHHLESFVERILRATYRGNTQQQYLGVIAASDFDAKVWEDARKNSLWTINLRQTFGDAALEALAQFDMLFREVETGLVPGDNAGIDELANLIAELKSNPIFADLRGIAFEMLAALVLRSNGFDGVSLGTDVPFNQSTRDVDAHGRQGDVVAIRECKAISSGNVLPDSDVTKFFTETVPAFSKWYRAKYGNYRKLDAELWTTGKIGENARIAFDAIQLSKDCTAAIRSTEEIREVIPSQIRQRLERLLVVIALPTRTNSGAISSSSIELG